MHRAPLLLSPTSINSLKRGAGVAEEARTEKGAKRSRDPEEEAEERPRRVRAVIAKERVLYG
jgi:hypothetical protein